MQGIEDIKGSVQTVIKAGPDAIQLTVGQARHLQWWPETIPGGTVSRELVTTMDILPTFAYLTGGEVPDDRIIDGHNIWSVIEGKTAAQSPYEVFYFYYQDQLQAVRRGPRTFVVQCHGRYIFKPQCGKSQSGGGEGVDEVGGGRSRGFRRSKPAWGPSPSPGES